MTALIRKSSSLTTLTLFLALILLLIPGCKMNQKVSDKTLQPADFAKVEELLAMPEQRIVMLDVRRPDRFQKEHIDGAFNIYMPQIRRRERLLTGDPIIIVYSSGEVRDYLSTAACKRLLSLGYGSVYDYRGGLKDWLKQEGATTSTTVMADLAE
ncbi:molybdopterin biosynthesis protein MoeB [Poriferisphaera corsica]|uniref:Molybdopterin biosynthesis protein MoeB n=1 Tax=Poriferisphaera corsica TaxID=2528020 RepID=A0A517YVW9_9BACT|nr:rhodanese-like domain-containing protein [Poriferisphaera corsica]QDU34353.1 molybdopterin biosynthesis protein MoeB [Poriferisphaera corsica]